MMVSMSVSSSWQRPIPEIKDISIFRVLRGDLFEI
jgi:hypothetical protein